MNKSQRLNLFDLIGNIIVIGLVACGAYFAITEPLKTAVDGKIFFELNASVLLYLPVVTACIILIGAFLMIWSNIVSIIKKRDCTPRFFLSIAFIGAVLGLVNTIMAFTVVNAFYAQSPFNVSNLTFSIQGGMIFFLLLIPVVSALQFIFFKIEPTMKFRKTFSPFIAVILYNIIILCLVLTYDATVAVKNFVPCFFYCVTDGLAAAFKEAYGVTVNTTQAIIILSASIIGTYVVSFIVWMLNRIMSLIIVGAEYRTGKKEEPKKKGGFKEFVKDKFSFNGTGSRLDHVYHISYHDRKKHTWKVKSEGAGRALKVFPTQKEAIEYAKNEVRKHGGSIRIHSMVGKMRKDVNWIN